MINDNSMGRRVNWRLFALLAVLITLASVLTFLVIREKTTCMQVPILRESDYAKLTVYEPIDLSPWIYQNGENAAIDAHTSTIYISQNISSDTHLVDLSGILEIRRSDYQLYFAPDEMFMNLKPAMVNGHAFELLAVQNNGAYMSYNVIFTSLPVLKIDGVETSELDEEGRPIVEGSLCLWTSNDPEVDRYTVKSSPVQWHVRGRSTSTQPKKSWKLSLKNEEGENKNLNMLNLGEDDDWILNSLTMDDSRIKEKLTMDVWNSIADNTSYNYKMSSGEFVEVVINGRYMGLYLLQRRVDAKYLQLSDSDVLLKAISYTADIVQEAYEFVTPERNPDAVYSLMQRINEGMGGSCFMLENFIDVNLLIMLTNARDNCGRLNMYHVLQEGPNGWVQYLVPWDTDQSFGVMWKPNGVGFCYDYYGSLEEINRRYETNMVAACNPMYEKIEKARWFELRGSHFSEEYISSLVYDLNSSLVESGAYERDVVCWGHRYGGEDSIDNLLMFIHDRLSMLDKIFK